MTNHNEVADVLDGAADVIERDGWHQGAYAAIEGVENGEPINGRPVCALGALGTATNSVVWSTALCCWIGVPDRITAAESALRRAAGTASIPAWNDAPERTKQEVLDALRYAAKSERRLADGIDQ